MTDGWIQLGDLLSAEGRGGDAVAAYDEALRRVPGLADVAISRGLAELKAGRPGAAEADARRALPTLPRRAEELLARVSLARGRPAEAESHARRAVALDTEPRPSALVVLATVLTRTGDYAGAFATLDEASRRAEALRLGRVRELESVRADALARAGRPAEAEAAYAREIAAFPEDLPAYANLAVLRFLRGDRAGVDAVLADMARRNPGPRALRVAAATRAALSKPPSRR